MLDKKAILVQKQSRAASLPSWLASGLTAWTDLRTTKQRTNARLAVAVGRHPGRQAGRHAGRPATGQATTPGRPANRQTGRPAASQPGSVKTKYITRTALSDCIFRYKPTSVFMKLLSRHLIFHTHIIVFCHPWMISLSSRSTRIHPLARQNTHPSLTYPLICDARPAFLPCPPLA